MRKGAVRMTGADEESSDHVDQMVGISRALVGGLTILAAAFTLVSGRDGGAGRILANAQTMTFAGVVLGVASVVLAFLGWGALAVLTGGAARRGWGSLNTLALVVFSLAVFFLLSAAYQAADQYERPALSASLEGEVVSFSASIPLLRADDYITVTVHGYPRGWENVKLPDDVPGEARGSELLRVTSGPDADGNAAASGSIELRDGVEYEIVEVRAYRNGDDRRCLPPNTNDTASTDPVPQPEPDGKPPTSCVQLWTQPRPPYLSN